MLCSEENDTLSSPSLSAFGVSAGFWIKAKTLVGITSLSQKFVTFGLHDRLSFLVVFRMNLKWFLSLF